MSIAHILTLILKLTIRQYRIVNHDGIYVEILRVIRVEKCAGNVWTASGQIVGNPSVKLTRAGTYTYWPAYDSPVIKTLRPWRLNVSTKFLKKPINCSATIVSLSAFGIP